MQVLPHNYLNLQNHSFDLQCEDRATKKPNKVKKSLYLFLA